MNRIKSLPGKKVHITITAFRLLASFYYTVLLGLDCKFGFLNETEHNLLKTNKTKLVYHRCRCNYFEYMKFSSIGGTHTFLFNFTSIECNNTCSTVFEMTHVK